jgi:hypothetical protein
LQKWGILFATSGISILQQTCKTLKIEKSISPKGNNGVEKLSYLFKKQNKVYIKGNDSENFIKKLDINLIINILKDSSLKKLIEILKKNSK